MGRRSTAFVGAFAMSFAALALVQAADSWSTPRTVDGHPDLEGVWNFATLTPLERPAQFAGKMFMTKDEAVEFEKQSESAATATLMRRFVNKLWEENGPLATVNGRTPTSLIVDPPDGRIPALTLEAQTKAAQRAASGRRLDSAEDVSVSERCLRVATGPPLWPGAPDANLIRIVQSRDHVAILQEKFHDMRLVSLDGRPHLPAAIRTWVGDSRGRWVGNTLNIDTTNFTHEFALGNRYDQNLHLMERFTRAGPNTLLYEFTVDDPTVYTKPWTAVLPMRRTGEQLYEFACHEGNYSLPNMLRGARFEDSH